MKKIQFSGLGIEVGQSKKGLVHSPQKARDYFRILSNAGICIEDNGDIIIDDAQVLPKFFSELEIKSFDFKKYNEAFEKNYQLLNKDEIVVSWGGDHSVGLSTVGAFLKRFNEGFVLWIDAHADLNLPEESITGHLHGMPLAFLMNLRNMATNHFPWIKNYLRSDKLIYLGIRDLDPFELSCIELLEIAYFSIKDIQNLGVEEVMRRIKSKVLDNPLHVSFDIDSVDPEYAPSTGVPVKKGLDIFDLKQIAKHLNFMNIKSIDIVEINPCLGSTLEVDLTYITGTQFLKNILAYPGGSDESMGNGIQAKHKTQMEWVL